LSNMALSMKKISLFALLSFCASLEAFAQEEVYVLDTVKVIGNKEGRTYTETPESVTILQPQRLDRADQNNSLEILNGQANVQVSNTRSAENFSIRGINNTGVTGFQKDNLASVFVDDIFQTDLAMRAGGFEVWDVKSLEIHRGPQSTSQGVNSLAGAILLQHKQANPEDEAALKLGYGTFNRREIGGMLNHALLDKKFAVRLSFNKDMNDGFISNKTTGRDDWGKQDKGHLALDMKYFFADKSELRFLNKLLRTDNGGNYTIGGNPFDYEVREDVNFNSTTDNSQHSLQYTKPLSEQWNNKTTLAFTKGLQTNSYDADGKPVNDAGTRKEKFNDQFLSLENVLQFQNNTIKNAFGLHAHQYRSFANYDFTLLYNNTTPVDLVQDIDKTRQTFALFDSLLYKLNANHSLNLGARYEFVKNDYGTYVNPAPTGNGPLDTYLNGVRGSYDGNQDTHVVLPKVGYIYQTGAHTWGLTYTQGYRIGGLDINRKQAKAVEYDPEKTDNYELSWKLTQEKFRLQTNIFYTYWKDQQVEVKKSNDFFDTQVENATSSEVYGGEVEGVYSFTTGDTLSVAVGHVRTHFLSYVNDGDVYTGNEFPEAPQWTAQTAWAHPFTDSVLSNLTVRHVSKTYLDAENTVTAPEQLYVDANLQYIAEKFTWEVNAKNVLDKKYVLGSSNIYGNTYKRVNRPREFNTRIIWYW